MTRFDAREPVPRPRPIPYEEHRYATSGRRYLPVPEPPPAMFWDVVGSRRSRRAFGPLGEADLSAVLWHAAKTRLTRRDESGSLWQSRPTPSAGGVHPIDILVIDGAPNGGRASLYRPVPHALDDLRIADRDGFEAFLESVDSVLRRDRGTLLWFVAQFGRTASRYENPETLVWRDAGALLATIGLVSEALGLACCGVGATGEPLVSRALGGAGDLYGAGGCIVGSRRRDERS